MTVKTQLPVVAAQKSTSTRIRALILEDRPEDAELMVYELRRAGFDPVWQRLETESDYRAQLPCSPDVILSDYRMPQLDAERALELLVELGLDIPFIVVAGAIGEEVAVAMVRKGAADYLLKDRLTRLGETVRRALDDKRRRDEKQRADEALRASEVRFSSFMNNSPALAFIKDEDGRMLYINATFERVWNTSLTECEGKLDHQLWPAAVAAQLRSRDRAVLESGKPSHAVEGMRTNGDEHHLLSFRFPFADAEGRRLLGGVSVDITEQMRTERALSAALAGKEVLLKEVHHRVKNNLQIISSLLYLQTETVKDPVLTQALREGERRVQAMALIHERLYSHDDIEHLDLSEYAEALVRDLFCCYGVNSGSVRLRLELEPVSLGLEQAIPCGLILNELVTNSLKYAFPGERGGEILVAISRGEQDCVTLLVADDGIGLPAHLDWAQSKSLGLRIVNILTRQLGGTLSQVPGPGAGFSLAFRTETKQPPQASGD